MKKKRRQTRLKRTSSQIEAIKLRNIKKGRFALCPVKAWATRGGGAPIGELRKWHNQFGKQVVVIKTKKGWEHYAPWLYRKHFGKVPANSMVTFKDSNQLNVVPENLMLITQQENGARNSKNRLPAELWETKRLLTKLNKTINNAEKQNKRFE